jgi:hypothetical protein
MASSQFIYALLILGTASCSHAYRTRDGHLADISVNDSAVLGENPCAVTEDLTPAEWQARFLSEFQGGQAGGLTNTVVIRLGTMGSGKSSAVNAFLEGKYGWPPSMFQIVDLDRMVTSSAAYRTAVCSGTTVQKLSGKEMGDAWWAGQVATSGYSTVDSTINDAASRGLTFSIEQTGKFMCPLRKVSRQLFKNGYRVIGASPYVPYYILKGRVEKRAEEEGRDVSTDELESNMKMFLPKLFDMVVQTDEFYILNNDVPFGHPPEVLLSSEIDWSKFDNQMCSTRTINKNAVEALLDKVKAASYKYTKASEREVHDTEVHFLQKLYEAADTGNPCEWD